MEDTTSLLASVHLGKKSEGSTAYDPSLIVPIPRRLNRSQYQIEDNALPFCGFDVWHAYEFSALTENGVPVTRLLKIQYPANSECIVESKSLKLYLNSFNMTGIGKTTSECLSESKKRIERDLSERLKGDVKVNFLKEDSKTERLFVSYESLMDRVNEEKLHFSSYKEAPEVLKTEDGRGRKSYFLRYDSLRSNCRVTHQPDFGDVFIYYSSEKHITEESLLEYLVSFRGEYHFHEECVEMIWKRLEDILSEGDELMVTAMYTRRGGIDINPVRYSPNTDSGVIDSLEALKDLTVKAFSSIKQ
ncbi:MAG: hypothetical protein KBS81_05655 [Spirochaetales bacterium]|nr:hypothetical protein [Candidatus Physcosoma equi]